MSNADVLRSGTAKAKALVGNHVFSMLKDATDELLFQATQSRIFQGHNMTGNTINSYAAGLYDHGKLSYIRTSWGEIPKPLRRKLTTGKPGKRSTTYFPEEYRWDGEVQHGLFTAQVQTNASTEADRCLKFLQSYQSNPNAWVVVVCNGVEYAEFQESLMQIDVLTSNFDYAKILASSIINTMPD